jgi:hypothetical protein
MIGAAFINADDTKPTPESAPVTPEVYAAYKEALDAYNKIQDDPAMVAARAVLQFAGKQVQKDCAKKGLVPKEDGKMCEKPKDDKGKAPL